jgi:hypothetical protein
MRGRAGGQSGRIHVTVRALPSLTERGAGESDGHIRGALPIDCIGQPVSHPFLGGRLAVYGREQADPVRRLA